MSLRFLSLICLSLCLCHVASAATCSFENEPNSVSWKVSNGELEIRFEHHNLTASRWTSIAFGNGPGMNNLEAIIFARGANDVVTTWTAFTPKKKKVEVDRVSYVKVKSLKLDGDRMAVTVTRPLGPAGPRGHSLDMCVNWIVVPGGSMKSGEKFKKHHGGIHIIKDVCAEECSTQSDKESRLLTNSIY